LSLVVTGANRHDVTQLEAVLDTIVVQRPTVTANSPQHLCADAGYVGQPALDSIEARGYTPHIRSRGEEKTCKQTIPGYRARRWVVEVCHSWLNRYRKILVRYEKKVANHAALLHLACAITAWRRVIPIYG
jgi:transposase